MAEESIKILFTPEITKDKGNSRRNSTGIVRKDSTGKSSSPNYLRSSTGSCHDFCKYGREHSFAVKERNPIPKRAIPPSDKKRNIGSEVLAEKKKILAVKPIPSTDSKIHSPEQNIIHIVPSERKKTLAVKLKPSPDLIHHSTEPPEIFKQEILLLKQNPSNPTIMKDKEMKMTSSSNRFPAPKFKPVTVRPSSSSTASVGSNGPRKTVIEPGKISGTSRTAVTKLLAPPTASFSPKPSGSSVVSLYTRKCSSLKLVSPVKKYQYRTWKAESKKPENDKAWKAESKKPDNDKVQEKILHVVGAETENKILEFVKGDGIIQISPSLSPLLQSPKLLSHPDSQFLSSNGDDVKSEYTDKEDLEQSECTDREDLEDSEYTDREDLEEPEYTESEADEFISENAEVVNINEVDTLKGNHNQTTRKGRVIPSEEKDNALAKSQFRWGKIVDLQSENNVPRRLRFRKGRVVDSNDSKSYARRRSFKKREVGDEKNGGGNPRSEKVVLRHQDMQQGKKDGQGLFNNVIEETASKLVESRKSKVKALVGAFETVISLQDSSKPFTQTGT